MSQVKRNPVARVLLALDVNDKQLFISEAIGLSLLGIVVFILNPSGYKLWGLFWFVVTAAIYLTALFLLRRRIRR